MAFIFAHVKFTCLAHQPVRLEPFNGSTLRGVFGHALRARVCNRKPDSDCMECHQRRYCSYALIFENPVHPGERIRGMIHAPHPYVIYPVERDRIHLRARSVFSFEMVFLEAAIPFFEDIILAWKLAGQLGFDPGGRPFELLKVTDMVNQKVLYEKEQLLSGPKSVVITPDCSFPEAEVLLIRTITPLRIVERKHLIHSPALNQLLRAMHRRLHLLNTFYGDRVPLFSWEAIESEMETASMYRRVKKVQAYRRSQRQSRRIPIDGLEGFFLIRNPGVNMTSLILQASVFNIGKSASLGMGRLSVTPTSIAST